MQEISIKQQTSNHTTGNNTLINRNKLEHQYEIWFYLVYMVKYFPTTIPRTAKNTSGRLFLKILF